MGVQSPGMKKNRIRLIGSIVSGAALVLALTLVVWGIPAFIDANRPTAVPAEVADVPVYLISDYRHPTPTPTPVVEQAPAPVEEGSGDDYVEPEPAPYVPTCEDQGLYTVDGSCVADLCYSYGDLDGDGVATDCLGRYY